MSYHFTLFNSMMKKHNEEDMEIHKRIENKEVKEVKTKEILSKGVTIKSNNSFLNRLLNIVKNPFTYLFNGKIEW